MYIKLVTYCGTELSFVVKESTRKNERDKVANLVYTIHTYLDEMTI